MRLSKSHSIVRRGGALLRFRLGAAHAATGGEPAAVVQVDVGAVPRCCCDADDMDKGDGAPPAPPSSTTRRRPRRTLVKALVARGCALCAAWTRSTVRSPTTSRALQLDPTLADLFNARGELWLKKGDKPKAGCRISAPR